MAFDGITVSNIVYELSELLTNGRIAKIAQPEKDELQLTIKTANRTNYRLLISANASLPLIYLTETNKVSPLTAPNFCMLLRKHLNSCKIISVKQLGLERVIQFELEHLNELGDLCKKYLLVELMGKHSNIIFCDYDPKRETLIIIDSIKRINGFVSSVREVLPGRDYFIPQTVDKQNPFDFDINMMKSITSKHGPISKAIYTTLTGFSPSAAHEICERAYIDSEHPANELSTNDSLTLYQVLENFIMDINHNIFTPNIAYENGLPLEFAVYPMSVYKKCYNKSFESVSAMLEQYYSDKEIHTRTRQKSSDLRRIVATALERNKKKLDLQYKQFKDTEKREKYKIYGELLTTYGYSAQKGDKSITCINYYNNEEITIPLNIELSPIDNAKKYFEKYAKLKRTFEALQIQIADTTEELNHLDSISNSLEIACNEADLNAIKNEMIDAGYIKKSFSKGKGKKQAKLPHNAPLHYISSDGFDIFVGKNNFQNDDLTFGIQNTDDWWFHAKGIAGSHVVLRGNGREITDLAFEEAGALAAHYSKAKGSDKVEIDYTELRNVKKPKGGKPGFVVYYTNYSLIATSNIQSLELSEDD